MRIIQASGGFVLRTKLVDVNQIFHPTFCVKNKFVDHLIVSSNQKHCPKEWSEFMLKCINDILNSVE